MSNKPRNPRHFPTMKVRGSSRRKLAPWQRMNGAFDRLSIVTSATAASMVAFARAVSVPKGENQ